MIRQWWSKVGQRWKARKGRVTTTDEDLLLLNNTPNAVVPLRGPNAADPALVRKKDSAEIVGEAVNKLVDRLEQINASISLQIQQNELLVDKINQIPDLLSGLPQQAQEQRQILQDLTTELKTKAANDQKLLVLMAGMSDHAAEQTGKLGQIHEHLEATAKVDREICDNLGKFNASIEKLDSDTVSQTEWIQQKSRAFSATDRYLKYTLARQQRRFMWIFVISMAVSLVAISGLVIGIVLLTR